MRQRVNFFALHIYVLTQYLHGSAHLWYSVCLPLHVQKYTKTHRRYTYLATSKSTQWPRRDRGGGRAPAWCCPSPRCRPSFPTRSSWKRERSAQHEWIGIKNMYVKTIYFNSRNTIPVVCKYSSVKVKAHITCRYLWKNNFLFLFDKTLFCKILRKYSAL